MCDKGSIGTAFEGYPKIRGFKKGTTIIPLSSTFLTSARSEFRLVVLGTGSACFSPICGMCIYA